MMCLVTVCLSLPTRGGRVLSAGSRGLVLAPTPTAVAKRIAKRARLACRQRMRCTEHCLGACLSSVQRGWHQCLKKTPKTALERRAGPCSTQGFTLSGWIWGVRTLAQLHGCLPLQALLSLSGLFSLPIALVDFDPAEGKSTPK